MIPDTVMRDFARAHGLLADGEDGQWTALTGGVSSEIWHFRSSCGEACIKRALPQLKVAATWEVPVDRNSFEWAYMNVVEAIVPAAVPRPIAHDPGNGLFAMTWMPPERFRLWKTDLLEGYVDPHFAGLVGSLLGRIHAATAADPTVPNDFATDANFHAIRIEPYLLATADKHSDIAATIRDAALILAATRKVLVHGDVSPKNILSGPDGPVLLDAECAWFGDPAFDIAFCLNHLALKARANPASRAALLDAFDRLLAAYFGQVDWENARDLEARAARLLPILMLARVDGKSPVEYLDVQQQTAVRTAARLAIMSAPDRLAEVRDLLFT